MFGHIPGFRVVIPRSPSQAKGLLLSAILDTNDPVIFMEPKILYRAAVEEVPEEKYFLPIGKAEVVKPGQDLTIISYGRPMYTCQAAIEAAQKDFNANIELIDLRTIYPWDRQTVIDSVKKTGRAMVVHESMVNYGVGSEVAATIQDKAFLHLHAPVKRLGGWTTHTGLVWEKYIFPDVLRMFLSLSLSVYNLYGHDRTLLTIWMQESTRAFERFLITRVCENTVSRREGLLAPRNCKGSTS